MPSPHSAPGGFLHSSLLSPPPSSTTSTSRSILPAPRSHPLRSGSAKESAFINHVDQGIMQVTRKYATKFSGAGSEVVDDRSPVSYNTTHDRGYESFGEVARDIERLLEVVWVSGTPSLQVSYLLSLALLVVTYLPSFPPAPQSMFRVLKRLDFAFASLIQGKDLDNGELLPGFGGGRGVSGTEKVRIQSLVERTRVKVVEVMGSGEHEIDEDDEDRDETGDEQDGLDFDSGTDLNMDIARVYDRTIVQLGDSLGGPSIGIPET